MNEAYKPGKNSNQPTVASNVHMARVERMALGFGEVSGLSERFIRYAALVSTSYRGDVDTLRAACLHSQQNR